MPSTPAAARLDCSPTGASASAIASPPGSVGAEAARHALLEAYQLGLSLREHIRIATIQDLDLQALYADIRAAIPILLPDDDPQRSRNTQTTWDWAVAKHSWRAVPMLVVALEGRSIMKRPNFFGALVKISPAKLDLSTNLQEIRLHQEEARLAEQARTLQPIDAAQRADLLAAGVRPEHLQEGRPDAAPVTPWDHMLVSLKRELGSTLFKTWIAKLSPAGLDGDTLVLCAPDDLHVSWVQKNYAAALKRAAAAAKLEAKTIVVRKGRP